MARRKVWLLRIEREMGRRRLIPKGPRSIDLDILLYGDFIVDAPGLQIPRPLQIPHPRIGERRFVLEPLAELAADLRDPRSGLTVRQMLAEMADQPVRRWEPAVKA